MDYKISTSFNWYETESDRFLIKTYYINEVAFTFDEVLETSEILEEANKNSTLTPEYFYRMSFYLIDEECHPCIFELPLQNPELLDDLDSSLD